ncbi:hypothetical protein, partial [Trueperella pyogenes]
GNPRNYGNSARHGNRYVLSPNHHARRDPVHGHEALQGERRSPTKQIVVGSSSLEIGKSSVSFPNN